MKTIQLFWLIIFVKVEARLELPTSDWNVTLAGGPHEYEGRLEIRPPDDVWGTVCDRNGTAVARACSLAVVHGICARLGYLAPYSLTYAGQRYSKADKPIWSQGFTCTREKYGNPCSLVAWSLHPTSCDHSSDLALLCIPPTFRLSAGCSPREGRVEVSVGTAGWAGFARCQQNQRADTAGDFYEADLICQHFGYKLALGLGGVCTNETQKPTLPLTQITRCGYAYNSWTECLRHTLMSRSCKNSTPSCTGPVKEVMCANDEEIVAISNTNLYGLNASVRLVDGPNDREGILELQFNETGWGPVCLHDDMMILAENVCDSIGSSCLIGSHFLSAEERGQTIEYLLRKKYEGSFFWVRLQNQCWRTGGHYLRITCSLEITLHGLTVSITPSQTCIGRCGEKSSPVQCGCDVMCETFQDCCYDVATECSTSLEWLRRNHTRHGHDLSVLLDNSHYYQCWSLDSNQNLTYQLVSECPDSWGEDDVRQACLLPSNVNPVLYRSLVPFKNVACFICHEATVVSSVDSNATNEFLIPVPLSDYEKTLRLCPKPSMVGRCPTHAYGQMQACKEYMAPHQYFKNPHCARCNLGPLYKGVCDKSNIITSIGSLVDINLIFPTVSPRRVHHHIIRVDPADFRTSMHATSLGVTAANEGAQTTNESIRSGLDSAKCLLQAIGYSNLGLALNFYPSLHQLLKSDYVNETVDNAVSLTTSYLESTSQLEEVLDDVLSQEKIRSGTDWVGRCGLAEVLASDKFNLKIMPLNYDTGSSGEVECFDVNSVNFTSVNISGNVFIFIANAHALFNPINRTKTIAYRAQAETTDKFKLVNYCGIKANNVTCEIQAEETEEIHGPDLHEVTLPSGGTLVCFSTIPGQTTGDRVSFDDPAQVLNVVAFSLSMAGLSATLATYSVFPNLRNVPGLAIMNLSLAILVGQLLAILSTVVIDPSHRAICITIAVFSHYVWLATFAWMAVMSWDLMRTFTTTSAKTVGGRNRFLRLCLIGWCAPLLFLIPNLILHFCDCTPLVFSYAGQVSCWLASSGSLYVMFYAPIALCICFNVACFAWTIRGIRASKKASTMVSRDRSRAKAVCQELLVYAKISSLMSFAWILGFVAVATEVEVFRYLFVIFCSLQGVFVFLSFAFSRQARTMWREKLGRPSTATALGTSLPDAPPTPVTTTSLG